MARVTKRPADEVVVEEPVETVEPAEPVETPVESVEPVETVETVEPVVVDRTASDAAVRDDMLAREKAEFGGMKFGSAFFGWLTAVGMGVLLTAIVVAIGTAIGLSTDDTVASARALGLTGVIAVAVVIFIAYFAGGYVAGRMARFSGAKQGFAVWLWAIIAAVVLGVLGVTLGAQFDVLARLDTFPRIPLAGDDLTLAGIVTAVVFALISLVGAILGGLAGMRYHRRVDRVGAVD